MMVETYLLRGKRSLDKWFAVPWMRGLGNGLLFVSGGFLLSGANLWGRMQPLAVALIFAGKQWQCAWAALGSAIGYRYFWGTEGIQGMVWVMGTLAIALLLPLLGENRIRISAAWTAAFTAAAGLAFQYFWQDSTPTRFFLARVGIAGGCALLGSRIPAGGSRLSRWEAAGIGVLALSNIRAPVPINPGYAAAGLLAAAAPLPCAAIAGLGADAGNPGPVSMTAVACCSWMLKQLPLRDAVRRTASPALACIALMVVQSRFDLRIFLAVAMGGVLGGLIPWQVVPIRRRGSLGAAQVKLEQLACVMTALQRQLLVYAPPPIPDSLLLEELTAETCQICVCRPDCRERERLDESYIVSAKPFPCRRARQMEIALIRVREQQRRIRLFRAQQRELRGALIRQYGFLSESIQSLSDMLANREPGRAKYRVQVSSRSRGKERVEGDRVLAFPGTLCRFYVLLCDGMGTGFGAAEEGREASALLRKMLAAGLSPASALGGLNNQLSLTGRAGAVTVDLAEIQLDSGCAWLYKWGAGPSWVLSRKRIRQLGFATAPPGIDPERFRDCRERIALGRKDVLVMASDGVSPEHAESWTKSASLPPGALAEAILETSGSREDDATVVVIRLERTQTGAV